MSVTIRELIVNNNKVVYKSELKGGSRFDSSRERAFRLWPFLISAKQFLFDRLQPGSVSPVYNLTVIFLSNSPEVFSPVYSPALFSKSSSVSFISFSTIYKPAVLCLV